MKLKDIHSSIPNGLFYSYEDDKGNSYRVNGLGLPFDKNFINSVAVHMKNNNVQVPYDLAYLIEQQICSRNPKICWEEAGDKLASIIHRFANLGDSIAHKLGVKTDLAVRSKTCKKCNERKNAMNKMNRK